MSPGVRPLRKADHAEVVRINRESRPGVTPLDETELTRLADLSVHHRVLIEPGAGVVGYLLAFSHRDAYDGEEFEIFRRRMDEPFLYVDQVAVGLRARRRGYGRRLYAALCHDTAGSPILCCEVNAVPPNPGSLAFHLGLGFRAIGRRRMSEGRTVDLLVRAGHRRS